MAIESTYTYICDECGHEMTVDAVVEDVPSESWHAIYRSWYNEQGEYESEEFNLCSDECAAAFDPREHRTFI